MSDATGVGNDALHVRIEKVVAGGDGLARSDDGRIVFVPSVLPGELVEIAISEARRDFARADLRAVIEPSPMRREPPCPHALAGCGGCDWQHIERRGQGQIKRQIVAEAYSRTGRMDVEPELRRMTEDARRTTVRVVAADDGRHGFRRHESHEIVPVASCQVAHDLINGLLAAPLFDGGGEATIRVGARTGDIGVWCHEGRLAGSSGSVRTGKGARVRERIGDHVFEVSMGSFFQSSPEAAELIVDSVTRRLDTLRARGGRLIDAYGGVGLFSVTLADRFDDVVLVESSPEACRDAVRNLADHAALIDQCDVERWDACEASVVVADPSRRGLGPRGVEALVATEADVVVLVSCDPVAGARDARLLVDAGYSLGEVEVLDIFPETHHVEVVAAFSR